MRGEIWFRIFHPAVFLQAFSLLSNHIQALLGSAPHLPSLSSLCSSAASDLPRPCDDGDPGNSDPLQWLSSAVTAFPHCLPPHPWASSQLDFLLADCLGVDSWKRTAAVHRSWWHVAWVLSESWRQWTCQQWRSVGLVLPTLQAVLGPWSFACWFVDLN